MKIFLSHHHLQQPLVRAIRQQLPEHVLSWIAEYDLLAAENIGRSIETVINDSTDFVVIFVESRAVRSKWVQQELEWALQREEALERPFVLPIVIEPDAWAKIKPVRLKDRKYIACHDVTEAGVRSVASELRDQLFAWVSRDLERRSRDLERLKAELKGLEMGHTGLAIVRPPDPTLQLFAHSDSASFRKMAEETVLNAHRVVLIGTGLNVLHNDPFSMWLIERVASGECELEVYLADPYSPAVQTRLIEEELGDIRPPVGFSGLLGRVRTLLIQRRDRNCADRFRIGLFTHYPTFALLIADDHYFIYPYGYATLGNFSPVLHFLKTDKAVEPMIDFLDRQYERVKADARDAQLVFDVREHRRRAPENLAAFALYVVPPLDSALYHFGTEVVGYNVHERKSGDSPWQDKVGSARDFGFHLTICDALYFSSEQDLLLAKNEVTYLLRQFVPFELVHLQVKPRTPDSTSVSIVAEDPSGSLEALHAEVVFRVYRRALASNYSLGLAPVTRDPRAELMIHRYLAPYVLKQFRPHLTLLTKVAPQEQSSTATQLDGELAACVPDRALRVDRLAIMVRPNPQTPWEIDEEIPLR